eukprot:TRINITY_DN2502_c0_g1_i18.p1 TRINITY_DN2502_c0_g1~~TRINITY_DN2502_c0_g1_i18.p1  ORF type:complete len:131 (-),score=15.07 TRINITY_DN2502_c0_g1_i18:137-529(-)
MYEEFSLKRIHEIGTGHDELCKKIRSHVNGGLPSEEIYSFVFNGFDTYRKFTERSGNWAGSSELIAFASALEVRVSCYGNDKIVSGEVSFDKYGRILPYLDWNAHLPLQLTLFQCWGGGHYRALVPNSLL